MGDQLFDLPAVDAPPKLGADARRTIRRNATIAAGRHPTTRLPLLADSTDTCGTCAHARCFGHGKRTYWKCELVEMTHGPATDIRLKWPACTGWADRARLADCATCAGKGRVVNDDRDPKSSTYLRCPTCHGRGQTIITSQGEP